MKPFLIVAMLLLSFPVFAQKSFTPAQFQSLHWLEGAWIGNAGTEPFYEAWRWANDSTLVNLSIEIKGGDTIIKEAGALLWRQGNLFLGQPPTQWTATRLMPNEIVLQNDSLRFSNKILWLHTGDGRWLTILEHPKSTVYYELIKDVILNKKVDAWVDMERRKKR